MDIAENEHSAVIMYKSGETAHGTMLVSKNDKGYKIGSSFFMKTVKRKVHESMVITLYNITYSNEYYIVIAGTLDKDSNIIIADNLGTTFNIIEDTLYDNSIIRTISSIDYSDSYILYIDGYRVHF